jgi:hypothetical protein
MVTPGLVDAMERCSLRHWGAAQGIGGADDMGPTPWHQSTIGGFERRMMASTMALLWKGDKVRRGVLVGMMIVDLDYIPD